MGGVSNVSDSVAAATLRRLLGVTGGVLMAPHVVLDLLPMDDSPSGDPVRDGALAQVAVAIGRSDHLGRCTAFIFRCARVRRLLGVTGGMPMAATSTWTF